MSAARPIRCAHVVATAGATGVERHLEALLAGMDRAEAEPVLFVPREGPLFERARARGIPVELGAPERKLATGAARRLADRFRGAFDLVHAHGPRALFWARRAARAARLPVVATVHELRRRTLPPGWKRTLWVALETHDLARVDRMIAVSASVRDALLQRHPEWAPRLSVVHGTTPMLLDSRPARVPAEPGRGLRVTAMGRLDWVKRHDEMLRAMAEWQRRGGAFELTVVGAGPERDALHALAGQLGLSERIRWLEGPLDPAALLSATDVFVTASRGETLGLAVLEAMLCGAVVAGVRLPAFDELGAGDAACWIERGPETTLADRLAGALETVAREPEQWAARAASAAASARERFDPRRLAAATVACYREVLAEARSAGTSAPR